MGGISGGLRQLDIARNETVGLQSAIDNLTRALAAYPHLSKQAEIFRHLGECYLLIGLNEQAHQAVQTALELAPESPALWLLNGQTLIRSNARQHASQALTHCLVLLSHSSSGGQANVETARAAHAELAAIAAADGNVEASIAELSATLALPPPPLAQSAEYIALWCALATAKERAGDMEGAMEACVGAERAVGRVPRILLTHAYLLLTKSVREPEGAVRLLKEVVGDQAGEKKREREEQDESVDSSATSVTGSIKNPLSVAASRSASGSPESPAKKLKTIDHNASAHNATDVIQSSPQTTNAPITGPDAALDWTSQDFLPYFLLGQAHSLLDEPRAAYDAYQVALRRAANLPISWLAVGKLYLKLKQLSDALAAYSQALRLQTEDATAGAAAWDGLSCVYERCDFQLADAADACDRCAACYRAIGDVDAEKFFEQRAKTLMQALRKEGPVPELRDPIDVPEFLVRDLVALLPSERIAYTRGDTGKDKNRKEGDMRHYQNMQPGVRPSLSQGMHPSPQTNMHQPPPPPAPPQNQPTTQNHTIHPMLQPPPPQPQTHDRHLRPEQFTPHSPAVSGANGSMQPGRHHGSPLQLPPPQWSPTQPPGMLRHPGMPMPPTGPQLQMVHAYAATPQGTNAGPHPPPPPPPGYTYGQYMPAPAMVGMPYPQPVNGWMR